MDGATRRCREQGEPGEPGEPGVFRRRDEAVEACAGSELGEGGELAPGDEPSPEMFRAIAETAVNPFAIIDDGGIFRWVGASVEELLGWRPDELVGRPLTTIVAPSSVAEALDAFADLDEVPHGSRYPRGGVGEAVDLVCRDGAITPCNVMAATRSQTGLPYHLAFASRAGYEQALDNALEAIAHHAQLDEVLVHLVATLQQWIPRSTVAIGDGWLGDRFAAAAGDGVDLLLSDPASPWARALATGEDVIVPRADDLPPALAALAGALGLASCWVHPVTVPGDDLPSAALVMWRPFEGVPTRFTWNAVRRTGRLLRFTLQWDRSHRALAFAATHDPLTGLANRPAFVGRLAEIAERAEGEAAVLFVDLDRFKPVNDSFGHLVGDRVLQAVAERLAGALRPGDLVARLGGDEFGVLCERLAHPSDAGVVADRLVQALASPITLDGGHEVAVTASVGVAELGPSEEPEAILYRADLAMREAKSAGRGRWVGDAPPAVSPLRAGP
ncbi:MAG TPA: sensor domain-containing diguanylate cyclase [Acidimicrobiales bacterium]